MDNTREKFGLEVTDRAREEAVPQSIWVLTCSYNEYDQHGAYFVAAWRRGRTNPTLSR